MAQHFSARRLNQISRERPRLGRKELSRRAGNRHCWLTTVGLVIFMLSLWIGCLIPGTLWSYKTVNIEKDDGSEPIAVHPKHV